MAQAHLEQLAHQARQTPADQEAVPNWGAPVQVGLTPVAPCSSQSRKQFHQASHQSGNQSDSSHHDAILGPHPTDSQEEQARQLAHLALGTPLAQHWPQQDQLGNVLVHGVPEAQRVVP